MTLNKKFSFEAIPFREMRKTTGGDNPPVCACQSYCSCYMDEITSHIALAVDVADAV